MPKAIRIEKTGGPEVLRWEDAEAGEPGAGHVRLRHTAVGVNFIDTYHRSGLYPIPLPSVLGAEGAGVVEAVGPGVSVVRVGDRVAYAGGPPGRTWSGWRRNGCRASARRPADRGAGPLRGRRAPAAGTRHPCSWCRPAGRSAAPTSA